jgi:hypothetical protein
MKPMQVVILARPAERLRALLDVVQRDVDVLKVSAAEADLLRIIARREPAPTEGELAEGLRALRQWFHEVTQSSGAALPVDGGSFGYILTEDGDLVRTFFGSFAATLVDETASLLQRAGPNRLRVCPLRLRTGERCGRLFIGVRHQKYCTPAHAQIEARRASRRREKGG